MRTAVAVAAVLAALALPAAASAERAILLYGPRADPTTVARGFDVVQRIPALHALVVRTSPGRAHAARAAGTRLTPDPPLFLQGLVDCAHDSACVVPDDPEFARQWYLSDDSATVRPSGGAVAGDDIDAPLGWALERGSGAVRIAIVDTGIDLGQPDLQGRVVASTTIRANHGDVRDLIGHGTAVAGVAAAIPDNGVAIAGVAYDASLLNVKVFSDGSRGSAPCSAVANGIVAAVRAHARVINVSSGGHRPCALLARATALAWRSGDLVVAAAGNDGGTRRLYPAAYPHVISVGATDAADRRARFSEHGASWVDLAAPGTQIVTVAPTYPNLLGPTALTIASGTSFSAPMVAGAAALLFARGLSNGQVADRLFRYARRIPGTGRDWRYGLLDVCASIAAGAPLCELDAATPGPSGPPVQPAQPAQPGQPGQPAPPPPPPSELAARGTMPVR